MALVFVIQNYIDSKEIVQRLKRIERKMAEGFDAVAREVGELETAVAAAAAEIAKLAEEVANLPVPEDHDAELAALAARIDAAGKALDAAVAGAEPAPAPEPEAPAEGGDEPAAE
jgi:peptidoglycan hydrolase CwlO-like protein